MGKCFSCGEFNTITEEIIDHPKATMMNLHDIDGVVTPIINVDAIELKRLKAPGIELNRVLGGGIVPGSVILLGGEPGIGKSTLLLQTALRMNKSVLYVSGEESLNQIKMRADRIGITNEECLLLNETCVENIVQRMKEVKPSFVIIDSIQTMFSKYLDSTPGTISQIRESSSHLIQFAKQNEVPIILVGHITKDGQLAGPKLLEHMVDTVLQFEGETQNSYRILRTLKNRFGSSLELGIYEMQSTGLREVSNPSEVLISEKDTDLTGTSIAATLEGMRPLMIEVQALVSTAVYGTPQRSSTGYNLKRLNMLLAVLEKRAGFRLGAKDVFLNIAGGLNVEDPAIDLAVVCAILSSNEDIAIPQNYCFAAEVGLSGEVRAVNRVEQRIIEAEKLGFEKIILSKFNKIPSKNHKIELIRVSKIEDVVKVLF